MNVDQEARATAFAALHRAASPLVLFNIWDPGSARAVQAGGASAVATGSWSVAAAAGADDGEHLPFELVLANLSRIVAAVDLPVTIDLERGYGADTDAVAATVAAVIEAGAVGCNIEDGLPDGELRPASEQVERITQVRRSAEATGTPFFVNARIDAFLQPLGTPHDDVLLATAVTRAQAYSVAGADGIFLPGLTDPRLIAAAVEQCDRPVNVMVADGTPSLSELRDLGVARVSHGPGPYLAAMAFLQEASTRAAVLA
ncbi:MAG: isocitrate lyase/PEP mutase family protein [Nocardioides sp.]